MRRTPRLPALLIPAALLGLPAVLAGLPAGAQEMPRPPQQAPQTQAPAPALPGLAARRPVAPIPGDPSANLSPNAALFDAVARGDIAAARDAVARGADVEARNALGLTALDAAVDQGRNDIAFYLLSARDVARSGTQGPPPSAARAPATPPAAAPRPARPAAPLNTPPAAAVAQPRSAALWAGNGGAPQPEIGFLGFDAGRPAGAVPPPEATPARRPPRG
ncbi:ankyrin repeat domain-containing protein [Falsiroseomonas ponticola]|uniref:ankyrin repeat domain-containing protein n=1 Tax=Falsiroseomonas ponticola TaxID=2786951 RepID=UPI001932211B|nr:ankyrin repeat domain-containing protein [Roseomonas ponticola]